VIKSLRVMAVVRFACATQLPTQLRESEVLSTRVRAYTLPWSATRRDADKLASAATAAIGFGAIHAQPARNRVSVAAGTTDLRWCLT
jgi:hypothetical protein